MTTRPNLDEMKAWLNSKLGREITVSQVTVAGRAGFLADYINYSAPATKLVGESVAEAISNLFYYLQSVETLTSSGPET